MTDDIDSIKYFNISESSALGFRDRYKISTNTIRYNANFIYLFLGTFTGAPK